jgi:hypothetical protein
MLLSALRWGIEQLIEAAVLLSAQVTTTQQPRSFVFELGLS